MKPEIVEYFKTVSREGLEHVRFTNLNRAQNAQKQIQELLEQAVDNLVEAELARILTENKIPRVAQAQLPAASSKALQLPRGERPVAEDPFEPWFVSKQEALAIRRQQTVTQQRRWTIYFDLWGCIACDRENVRHHSKGLCERCHVRIISRLKQIDRTHSDRKVLR